LPARSQDIEVYLIFPPGGNQSGGVVCGGFCWPPGAWGRRAPTRSVGRRAPRGALGAGKRLTTSHPLICQGNVPLMIEHMKGAEEYDKSWRYLFELGRKVGVSFG
jgi:hypothetical protein